MLDPSVQNHICHFKLQLLIHTPMHPPLPVPLRGGDRGCSIVRPPRGETSSPERPPPGAGPGPYWRPAGEGGWADLASASRRQTIGGGTSPLHAVPVSFPDHVRSGNECHVPGQDRSQHPYTCARMRVAIAQITQKRGSHRPDYILLWLSRQN